MHLLKGLVGTLLMLIGVFMALTIVLSPFGAILFSVGFWIFVKAIFFE